MPTIIPPQLIADRYLLVEQVGTSTMSTVYRAEDTRKGNRTVAVKLLNSVHTNDLKKELFRRETKALEKLEHPNIITAFDSGWSQECSCYYLVLEYIPRTLLDVIMVHQGEQDRNWCWPIIRAITEAIVHAHSLGVIHRDLKPSNILISSAGETNVKISDFGISLLKFEVGTGTTVSAFWSIGYASPEQRIGQQANERSDIYSLACVFYHLLSGQEPPSSGITQQHLSSMPIYPSMKRMLGKMLDLDPDKRIESAVQLRRQLEMSKNFQEIPSVRFRVTAAARKMLFDLGLINRSSSEAACQCLREELGEEVLKEVSVTFDEREGMLRVLTESLLLLCVRERSSPQLVITAIYTSYQPQAERQKNWSVLLRYDWEFTDQEDAPSGPQDEQTLDALFELLATHRQTRAVQRSRREERKNITAEWDRVLSYQKTRLDTVPRLQYNDMYREGNTVTFLLADSAPDNLSWPESAPISVTGEEKKHQHLFIGYLMSVNGNQVQVSWEPTALQDQSRDELSKSGLIGVFQQEAKSALERQHTALTTLAAGKTVNPRLPELLQDLSTADFDPIDEKIVFFQPGLAEDKQRAVKQALAAKDIFLLQGPPGTGKTTTLTEIILQILKVKPDARILVSSQSNVAVNHVLSKVAQLREGQRTEIVRIGRADKIGHGAQAWTLEQRLESWRKEVLAKTEGVMQELKGQIRQQQRQRTLNATLDTDHTAALEECLAWLDELGPELDELETDERLLSMLNSRLVVPGPAHDYARMQRELAACEQRIAERKSRVEPIFELTRSYLPHEKQIAIVPRFTEERDRLYQTINSLLHSGEFHSSETEQLSLVQRWRKIFGKQSDFAEPILERAQILAATCLITGARYLRSQEFDWAIIDEAGRATAPELLVPMIHSKRCIIVGDERQLPPMLDEELSVQTLASMGISRESLAESLFSSLVEQGRELALPAVHMLTVQHRMHPAIGRLVSNVFYDGKLQHGVEEHDRAHNLDWLPNAVVWFSTTPLLNHNETRHGQSFYNLAEVRAIHDLLLHMERSYEELEEKRDIAVITPYNAQIAELKIQLTPQSAYWKALDIEISTIDAFQGRDRDIVLYSPVRSNKEAMLGFLRDRRRLNVALSRARQVLIIIGDVHTLENGRAGREGNPYQELVRYIRNNPADCLLTDWEAARG